MPKLKQPFKKTEDQLAEEYRKERYSKAAEDYLELFCDWLKTKQACSDNTTKTYLAHLRIYYKWLNNHHSTLEKLHTEDILKFKETNSRAKAHTINLKLSSLKKYNEFLIDMGQMQEIIILKNHFTKIQARYANPTTVTKEDIDNSLEKIQNSTHNRFKNRDYLIVYMLIRTGLRVSELSNIKLRDINLSTHELHVVGKGNKERTVYITPLINLLKKYLKNERTAKNYEKMVSSEYLFPTTRTEKISPNYIWKMLKSYGIEFHPHQCRHYFCTSCVEGKMNLHELANQSGHSSIQTLMLYTNPSKEKMKQKMAEIKF